MKEKEIEESYEKLRKTAEKALEESKNGGYDVTDVAVDVLGFVFTVAVAFGWLMLVLLLISFVGLSYVHMDIHVMLLVSLLFAVAVAVFKAVSLGKKYFWRKKV